MKAMLLALLASLGLYGEPRAVFRTRAGDLIVRLDMKAAPRNAAKIKRLVELGAYDGTYFFRIVSDQYAHLSGISYRGTPLDAAQLEAASPLQAEPGGMPHRYGIVTIAHTPAMPDPTQTSLAFMVRDAPHFDGKFTAVGVVENLEILEALRKVPTDPTGAPLERLEVKSAFITPSRLYPFPPAAAAAAVLAFVLLWWRTPLAHAGGLLLLLGAYLGVLGAYLSRAQASPAISLTLFLGAMGLFRLLSSFELGRQERKNLIK